MIGLVFSIFRKTGVEIIVIGIGEGIDPQELDHMAGGAGKAFTAKSFDELIGGDFVTKLVAQTCKAGKKSYITSTLPIRTVAPQKNERLARSFANPTCQLVIRTTTTTTSSSSSN